MGVKISRAQESARHAYRRGLEKSVRSVSKGSGWRVTGGSLFRDHSGIFVSASPAVLIYENSTNILVSAKPMTIDPIFWDIVGLSENSSAPLSFRLNGAWTCRPPYFAQVPIAEQADPDMMAASMLEVANERLAHLTEHWSLEWFIEHCRTSGLTEDSFLPCVVTSLIFLGREPEALAVCESAYARGAVGGFLAPEGTFTEMATRWILASLAKSTRQT